MQATCFHSHYEYIFLITVFEYYDVYDVQVEPYWECDIGEDNFPYNNEGPLSIEEVNDWLNNFWLYGAEDLIDFSLARESNRKVA